MAWAPNYVTPEELAAYVRVGDTADDAQLALAIASASRAIDKACRRQFGKVETATARIYTARLDAVLLRWVVDIDDLMTTDELLVEVDTAGDGTYSSIATGYSLRPVNAAADGEPWSQLALSSAVATAADAVRVTALWGWAAVPEAIREACLLQASRLIARRDAPFGVAGSPEVGSEVRLLAKVDPDVEVSLRPYRRTGWVFA